MRGRGAPCRPLPTGGVADNSTLRCCVMQEDRVDGSRRFVYWDAVPRAFVRFGATSLTSAPPASLHFAHSGPSPAGKVFLRVAPGVGAALFFCRRSAVQNGRRDYYLKAHSRSRGAPPRTPEDRLRDGMSNLMQTPTQTFAASAMPDHPMGTSCADCRARACPEGGASAPMSRQVMPMT